MQALLNRKPSMPIEGSRLRAGWTWRRLALVLARGVLVLCSIGLIVAGGYLLTEATSKGAWVSLGHGAYDTDSYAVITEPEDWDQQSYVLGTVDKVRIRVTPRNTTTPVFVGLA